MARPLVSTLRLGVGLQSPAEIQLSGFFPRGDDAPFRVFFRSAFPTPGLEVNGGSEFYANFMEAVKFMRQ